MTVLDVLCRQRTPLLKRICRVCLRHEWQERREVPPPPSEFERLKGRLHGSE